MKIIKLLKEDHQMINPRSLITFDRGAHWLNITQFNKTAVIDGFLISDKRKPHPLYGWGKAGKPYFLVEWATPSYDHDFLCVIAKLGEDCNSVVLTGPGSAAYYEEILGALQKWENPDPDYWEYFTRIENPLVVESGTGLRE